jgi:hypothetical protein
MTVTSFVKKSSECRHCGFVYMQKRQNQKYCDAVCNSGAQATAQRERNKLRKEGNYEEADKELHTRKTIDKGWLSKKWELPRNYVEE